MSIVQLLRQTTSKYAIPLQLRQGTSYLVSPRRSSYPRDAYHTTGYASKYDEQHPPTQYEGSQSVEDQARAPIDHSVPCETMGHILSSGYCQCFELKQGHCDCVRHITRPQLMVSNTPSPPSSTLVSTRLACRARYNVCFRRNLLVVQMIRDYIKPDR